jgi:hypothetical protein
MIIRIASVVVSLAGGLALITGLLFWAGTALNLISMHMLLGFLTVAALWVAAVGQALARGGSWFFAVGALALGAATIYVGLHQTTLGFGDSRWVIQALHLVLGILTIGAGHMASARYRKSGQ